MKWINLFGLILQFLAFWFAAPELLGKSTLERFELGLKRLVSAIPMIVIMLIILLYSALTAGIGIYKGMKGASEGLEEGEMMNYLITLGLAMVVYFIFIFASKRIQRWLAKTVADPLIDKLIDQGETRKNALIIGAVIFSVGFLLQSLSILFT
tara:strand:- start:2209 stop:2667 length:459 start_codon:yes stop_codon:yes gene_type:complete